MLPLGLVEILSICNFALTISSVTPDKSTGRIIRAGWGGVKRKADKGGSLPVADNGRANFRPDRTYLAEFAGADGGKNAHYMLRWINAKGEKGPWSETASGTISA